MGFIDIIKKNLLPTSPLEKKFPRLPFFIPQPPLGPVIPSIIPGLPIPPDLFPLKLPDLPKINLDDLANVPLPDGLKELADSGNDLLHGWANMNRLLASTPDTIKDTSKYVLIFGGIIVAAIAVGMVVFAWKAGGAAPAAISSASSMASSMSSSSSSSMPLAGMMEEIGGMGAINPEMIKAVNGINPKLISSVIQNLR